MSGYAGRLRRALSLRRPVAAPAVELLSAAPDPKLPSPDPRPALPDPKLATENDAPSECSAPPVQELWSFDNPPPWHKQFTVGLALRAA